MARATRGASVEGITEYALPNGQFLTYAIYVPENAAKLEAGDFAKASGPQ